MKALAITILALASVSAQARCRTDDNWTGPDKTKHFFAGAALGSAATVYFKRPDYGFWAGTFVGFGKELLDARSTGHTCSLQDFAVTAAGAAAGAYGTAWVVLPKKDGVQVAYAKRF